MTTNDAGEARARELQRRIEAIEAEGESTLGRFTALDWAVCVIGSIVLPIFLLVRCA